MSALVTLARVAALDVRADQLERMALEAPPEERDALARDAIAARARMLDLLDEAA